MNDFEQRWHTLTRRASSLGREVETELPFGFATSILARCRQSPVEPWEDILSVFGVRALLITACMAVIGGGVGFFDWYDFRIERPKLEQTLTSELPWP
ncbi:MAG: hypothetical protein U0984_04975 [Prosthecobacter sp.]|nr:hypothetical protein [Prosthecobacter sp.]